MVLANKKPDWGFENPDPVDKNRIKADKIWQKRQTTQLALVWHVAYIAVVNNTG